MFKKLLYSSAAALIGFMGPAQIQGEIIESNEIISILNHVTEDSLVLFNITGTLYEPATTLADNQWRLYFAERVKKLANDQDAGQKLIDKIKNEIVVNIPKKAVEETTPLLIANLQKQKVPVLGITQKYMSTSYADNFGEITYNHLLNLGIDLEKTLSFLNVTRNEGDDSFSFGYGMIFSNKKPVGPALLSFLKLLSNRPSKIVMVDNAHESLANAEAALESTGIEFKGIRYGLSDIRKKNFDPALGTLEFFAFKNEGKVMSDDEALQIKLAHPKIDYDALLDNFIKSSL